MAIQMTGKNLTVEKIVKVARDREKIAHCHNRRHLIHDVAPAYGM